MEITINETEKFEIVMGVVAGYFHNNEAEGDQAFGEKLQEVQAGIFKDTGLYISVVWKPAMVSYSTDWGCPVGGEKVYQITGTRNPQFCEDKDREVYQKAVELLCVRLMEAFHQTTATLEWQKVELSYYKQV